MTWEPSGDEPWNKHTVVCAVRHIHSAQGDQAFVVTQHNDMWVEVAFDWPDAIRLVSCGRC